MRQFLILLLGASIIWACEDLDAEADRLELETEASLHETLDGDSVLTDSALEDINDPGLIRLERRLNKLNFEDSITKLYEDINLKKYNLPLKVFRHAMVGFYGLKQENKLNRQNLLSIIDFTQSSCDRRFYTIDLDAKKLLFNTLVSHGRNTGANMASKFSNKPGSNQSSLGFYVTAETYVGSKGYSMRLDGAEPGVNDNMRKRAVVMHDAPYVSQDWVKRYGRIGRSQGCPALPKEISKKVIDKIKNKTAIFAYYNDDKYLEASEYVDLEKLMAKFGEDEIESDSSKVDISKLDTRL